MPDPNMPASLRVEDPVNFCLDKEKVNALFRFSALQVAMAKRSSIQRENISNPVLDAFLAAGVVAAGPFAPIQAVGAYFARKALTDGARVDLEVTDSLKAEAAAVNARFCSMYENYALRGLCVRYLLEVRDEGYRAWRQVQDQFERARAVNDSAIGYLTSAYDWTSRIKVAADVGMVVVGAFVPLGFLANTAAGLAYSFGCKFANTVSEAGSSDLHSYSIRDLKSDASGAGGNLVESFADRPATDARDLQLKKMWMKLEAASEKQGQRLEEAMARVQNGFGAGEIGSPVQRAAAKAGFNVEMTAAQKALAQKAVQPFEAAANSAAKAAQAARLAAKNPPNMSAFEAYRNSPSALSKAGVVAARGGAILVGLYFLKDEILEAFVEGQTAADDRKFRAAHGLSPR